MVRYLPDFQNVPLNSDPSQVGVFRADTANDALLYAALSSQLFSPSAPVANATIVASYLADFNNRTGSVNDGYPTVEGATAGRRKVSSPPLLVDLVAADALAGNATDAALGIAIDKQLAAFRAADVRVFIFLCPVGACISERLFAFSCSATNEQHRGIHVHERAYISCLDMFLLCKMFFGKCVLCADIARKIGYQMSLSGQFGRGYSILLAPHLKTSALFSARTKIICAL